MFPKISKITEKQQNISTAVLIEDSKQIMDSGLTREEEGLVQFRLEKENTYSILKFPLLYFFGKIENPDEMFFSKENARIAGAMLYSELKAADIRTVQLTSYCKKDYSLAFLEGVLLSSYSFDKYKKEKEDFVIDKIFMISPNVSEQDMAELINLVKAVFVTRDWVNEPLSFLTATQFSTEMEKLGQDSGFLTEVFNKQKIESLKMGGLLAVNKGSIDPPTFNILEWHPQNAKNKKPVVLVGKGIVFDTGGLSLKPTSNSMDFMKTDMAGGAVIAATIYAIALNKLPIYVVGLIPATDNRPDGNAYVPGDVITMFDGTTVEVKNTDAEGRLVLADALSYAQKYDPELVIDYATLTGAADIIAGPYAAVVMGNAKMHIEQLKSTGFDTYERIIEVPLWKEYDKALKSEIADLNNLGTREAQSTVAGKFLEHFTDYNWIHIDAAGTPYLKEKDGYRPKGGTGFGTRLLYHFLKKNYFSN